jgi:DNA modification methylase
MIELYLGDCVDVLRRLQDLENCVIVTDPPYTIRTPEDCAAMLKRIGLPRNHALVLTNPEHGYIWRGGKYLADRLAPRSTAQHPHQRPAEELVEVLRMTEGVVLDPYAGSGSTLLAAAQLGRPAIGIERDAKYWLRFCEVAAELRFGRGVKTVKVTVEQSEGTISSPPQ